MTGETNSDRRVLVVGPSFFGYEHDIAAEFSRQGLRATFFDERPSNQSILKALLRSFPKLARMVARRHLGRLASVDGAGRFDLILIIKGEQVSPHTVAVLRRINPRAVLAFYAYDSFANSAPGRALVGLVDHAYSFDPVDAATVPGVRYKPLFHTSRFVRRGDDVAPSFDVAFVGTMHSDRYRVVQSVLGHGGRTYAFFYSPARWYDAVKRLVDRRFRAVPRHEMHFEPLSADQVAEVFRASETVVDVQREGQLGLTMRTFEVLASGARLITTNPAICKHDFYDPRWVHVLPVDLGDTDHEALARFVGSVEPVPVDIVAGYSLAQWVHEFVALVSPAAVPT